jgi:hypothetical protein
VDSSKGSVGLQRVMTGLLDLEPWTSSGRRLSDCGALVSGWLAGLYWSELARQASKWHKLELSRAEEGM